MPDPGLPLILEPEALESAPGRRDLLVVHVGSPSTYATAHIPGAVHLDYPRIVAARPPAMGLLPEAPQLSEALSSLGMRRESHVVAYDGEGSGRACRLLWTLDVIGHGRFSLANGGLHAWTGEARPTQEGLGEAPRGDYRAGPPGDGIADKDYVLARLDDPDVVILDCRSPGEFSGADRRAARGGHIPGAVNMDWTLAMDRERDLRLKGEGALRDLLEGLGVTPDKEVIAHCHTHHRSSHTYIALKSLGYPRVKAYPGSWSEWGNDPELPVET